MREIGLDVFCSDRAEMAWAYANWCEGPLVVFWKRSVAASEREVGVLSADAADEAAHGDVGSVRGDVEDERGGPSIRAAHSTRRSRTWEGAGTCGVLRMCP